MRCALALPSAPSPNSAAAHRIAAAMFSRISLVRVCVFLMVCLVN
jgi:hypothetical protein